MSVYKCLTTDFAEDTQVISRFMQCQEATKVTAAHARTFWPEVSIHLTALFITYLTCLDGCFLYCEAAVKAPTPSTKPLQVGAGGEKTTNASQVVTVKWMTTLIIPGVLSVANTADHRGSAKLVVDHRNIKPDPTNARFESARFTDPKAIPALRPSNELINGVACGRFGGIKLGLASYGTRFQRTRTGTAPAITESSQRSTITISAVRIVEDKAAFNAIYEGTRARDQIDAPRFI